MIVIIFGFVGQIFIDNAAVVVWALAYWITVFIASAIVRVGKSN